jgi:hypothetical protein
MSERDSSEVDVDEDFDLDKNKIRAQIEERLKSQIQQSNSPTNH